MRFQSKNMAWRPEPCQLCLALRQQCLELPDRDYICNLSHSSHPKHGWCHFMDVILWMNLKIGPAWPCLAQLGLHALLTPAYSDWRTMETILWKVQVVCLASWNIYCCQFSLSIHHPKKGWKTCFKPPISTSPLSQVIFGRLFEAPNAKRTAVSASGGWAWCFRHRVTIQHPFIFSTYGVFQTCFLLPFYFIDLSIHSLFLFTVFYPCFFYRFIHSLS